MPSRRTTVRRQYVLLKKADLKDIKDDAGVKDWEKDKNIAADLLRPSAFDGRPFPARNLHRHAHFE